MGLNLYRRHRSACKGGHPHNHHSGDFDERKKGWKRCECPIFVSGTLSDGFDRKSTGEWDWEKARKIAHELESKGSWNGLPAPVDILPTPPATDTAPISTPAVKISDAISKFLADHKGGSAGSTTRMYGYLLTSFTTFSEQLGYIWIHQWRPEDVREFRQTRMNLAAHQVTNTNQASATRKATTTRKDMSNLKAFFEFCLENRWIVVNPARIKARRTRKESAESERIPFSDEELERMFLACADQYGQNKYAYRYKWAGQDLSDFIAISVYTGLRISDVVLFRARRLKANGECFIRATKNNKEVCTWIPSWLQERINSRSKQFGDLIFGKHATENIESITDQWRRRLIKLWKLCGPWPEKPEHHRFRHTFARILLQQGDVTVRDVAELLGDTEATVRKYYGKWVTERQERVTEVLRQAFAGKPVPMPKMSKEETSLLG